MTAVMAYCSKGDNSGNLGAPRTALLEHMGEGVQNFAKEVMRTTTAKGRETPGPNKNKFTYIDDELISMVRGSFTYYEEFKGLKKKSTLEEMICGSMLKEFCESTQQTLRGKNISLE